METKEVKIICVDACVWINYLWQSQFTDSPKKKSNSTRLIEALKSQNEYEVLLSPFLISEISSHFRDFYISQKIIQDGFSYREFHQEKKNYSLNEDERSKIDDMIISIGSLDFVNVLQLQTLKKEVLSDVLDLEASYYFDFFDALHLLVAKINGSLFFITTDNPLLKSADSHNKYNGHKYQCMKPKSLLDQIK